MQHEHNLVLERGGGIHHRNDMSCEDHSYENQIRSNSKPTDQAFRTRAAYEEHQGHTHQAKKEVQPLHHGLAFLFLLQHPNPEEMPGAMPYSVALQIQ